MRRGRLRRFSVLQQRANCRNIMSVLSFGRGSDVCLGCLSRFIIDKTDVTVDLLYYNVSFFALLIASSGSAFLRSTFPSVSSRYMVGK